MASGPREGMHLRALIFDCDGVLADTERDGHRVAFNRAFATLGYDIEWDIELYGTLLKVAGGKERMEVYFKAVGWPAGTRDRNVLLQELHRIKTDAFRAIVESGELQLRPGVVRLVDEALAAGVDLMVCSTSNERAVGAIVNQLGTERRAGFRDILTGDVVSQKKPDPAIYLLALERLAAVPTDCFVIEDNRNGLLAAKAAGIPCVITTSYYSRDEDFSGADIVVEELGDPPRVRLTFVDLEEFWRKHYAHLSTGVGKEQRK